MRNDHFLTVLSVFMAPIGSFVVLIGTLAYLFLNRDSSDPYGIKQDARRDTLLAFVTLAIGVAISLVKPNAIIAWMVLGMGIFTAYLLGLIVYDEIIN